MTLDRDELSELLASPGPDPATASRRRRWARQITAGAEDEPIGRELRDRGEEIVNRALGEYADARRVRRQLEPFFEEMRAEVDRVQLLLELEKERIRGFEDGRRRLWGMPA
jgi:hypothetical protein